METKRNESLQCAKKKNVDVERCYLGRKKNDFLYTRCEAIFRLYPTGGKRRWMNERFHMIDTYVRYICQLR
ncbi:hypothetical protein BLOT_005577 [Blomia tropicalis]|nr:hypothetical protein BLOT_005577 [Blomia tropicalis]